MSGWGCPHFINEECVLLKGECNPGQKGCVLFGMVTFSNPENPSNEAVKRREEKAQKKDSSQKKFKK